MTFTHTVLIMTAGALVAAAALLIIWGVRRPQPDLASALQHLSDRTGALEALAAAPVVSAAAVPEGIFPRLGGWLMRRFNLRPSGRTRALLHLHDISAATFYGHRLGAAVVLALMPAAAQFAAAAAGLAIPLVATPLAVVAAAIIGWMYPALHLRSQARVMSHDALDALLVYVDLVVVERLGNSAAVDALTNAAAVSANPLFVQIQRALSRAALERTMPWDALHDLATELNLPQLRDVVAIAQLQERGGALVPQLRARVADLRDAQLRGMHEQANVVTQRMAVYKVLPVTAFMAVLLASPLLSLIG